jgi:hypothetical protein
VQFETMSFYDVQCRAYRRLASKAVRASSAEKTAILRLRVLPLKMHVHAFSRLLAVARRTLALRIQLALVSNALECTDTKMQLLHIFSSIVGPRLHDPYLILALPCETGLICLAQSKFGLSTSKFASRL